MKYHIDAKQINLDDLRKRIENTDLVPSRMTLLEGIEKNFKVFNAAGIKNLADLRYELKNAKRLETLVDKSGVDKEYLILLRREIEGYFPKSIPLKKFDWLPLQEIEKLEQHGIGKAAALFETTRTPKDVTELQKSTSIDDPILKTLMILIDLTRIQWVSPLAARMLMDAGYNSVKEVAAADPEVLCEDLVRINEGDQYFKGKIGLRDIKRLIHAAGYLAR